MSSQRFYLLMIGITVALGISVIGVAFLGDHLLQQQSKKLTSLKLDSKVLDEQQTSLSRAKKDIQKYSELEREAKIIVPQDKDQAEAVREIVKIAKDNGVTLATIGFPTSTLGQSTIVAPGSSSSSTKPSTKVSISQVQPVKGINGLFVLPINIQQDSASPILYSNFINFLKDLEQNRRTAQVSSINIQPNVKNRNLLSFTLTVNVYIKP